MNFIKNKDFLEFGRADKTLINDLLQNQPIQTYMNKPKQQWPLHIFRRIIYKDMFLGAIGQARLFTSDFYLIHRKLPIYSSFPLFLTLSFDNH